MVITRGSHAPRDDYNVEEDIHGYDGEFRNYFVPNKVNKSISGDASLYLVMVQWV